MPYQTLWAIVLHRYCIWTVRGMQPARIGFAPRALPRRSAYTTHYMSMDAGVRSRIFPQDAEQAVTACPYRAARAPDTRRASDHGDKNQGFDTNVCNVHTV